jgi:hypothetical protein
VTGDQPTTFLNISSCDNFQPSKMSTMNGTVRDSRSLALWKRIALRSFFGGVGMAVALAAIVGGWLWYESRPKPPKPWNRAAIKAEYESADTEGSNNTIVVYYVLENTTDFDYQIEDGSSVSLDAQLDKDHSLSNDVNILSVTYPVVVLAKKRMRFAIHVNYPCTDKEKPNADRDEMKRHTEAVEAFMTKEFANLDGFDLLDETSRYEILLPGGWRSKK